MKNVQIFLLYFFLILVTLSNTSYAQTSDRTIVGMSKERLERYDVFLQNLINQTDIPGAVLMVSRNGKMIHQTALGHRNIDKQQPMAIDDIFYIQSMTKPIISVAFMMLYEEGHFLLTDPVSKYLPAFKTLKVAKDQNEGIEGETEDLKTPITMVNLLTHTAGFSHGLGSNTLDKEVYQQQYGKAYPDIQSRVDNLLSLPLKGQPGQQWYYSSAPDVISVLIEQFSGMSTKDFLNERIFKPLDMQDTGYNLSEQKQSRLVHLHVKNEEGKLVNAPEQVSLTGNNIWSGVNGLFSTATDYTKFCQMLLNGGTYNDHQFLSPKTIDLMTSDHVGDMFFYPPGHGFGLGFAVTTDVAASKNLGSKGSYHWSGLFNTHFFVDPKENIIAIFMTQTLPYNSLYHNKLKQMVHQAVIDKK